MKILLIEDDVQLKNSIERYFLMKKFEVLSFEDGDEAFEAIQTIEFDAYIFDINIPNISGLELLEYVKKEGITKPVMLITASLEIAPLEKAYELGCTEYIKKPFDIRELELRLNAIMPSSQCIYFSDESYFDTFSKELYLKGLRVDLRPKELELLSLLANKVNHIVSKAEINKKLWRNMEENLMPIRQLLADLRKKLDTDCIVTYQSVGYELKGDYR